MLLIPDWSHEHWSDRLIHHLMRETPGCWCHTSCMAERICWKCGQRGSLYSVPEHQTWWIFMLITCGHRSNSVRVWVPKLETCLYPFPLSCYEESKLCWEALCQEGLRAPMFVTITTTTTTENKLTHQMSNFATCSVQINSMHIVSGFSELECKAGRLA